MTTVPQERSWERSWHRQPEPSPQADRVVAVPRQPGPVRPQPAAGRRARRRPRSGLVAALSALPWPSGTRRRR